MRRPVPAHAARCLGLLCALAALMLTACGSADCAPAGTYVPTLTRNAADPGDCPPDVEVLEANTLSVTDGQACGAHDMTFSGSGGCSYEGSGRVVASESGLRGTARIETNCWGDESRTCTARYEITYAREGS